MFSVGWLVAYLTVLLVVAEPLRNTGKYTMADVLAYRLNPRPVRAMAALSTITVSTFYMIAQMVGAGALVTLLLGSRARELSDGGHRRRRAHDHLRCLRRNAGHDVGANHQGDFVDGGDDLAQSARARAFRMESGEFFRRGDARYLSQQG